jgi:hypothetical protein
MCGACFAFTDAVETDQLCVSDNPPAAAKTTTKK